MSKTTITSEVGEKGGRYMAAVEGYTGTAEMSFSQAGAALRIIDHTEVADDLRGLGIGLALAEHAVTEARKSGMKLFPLCPFFMASARKHPDWHDVVQMPGQS